MNSKNCSRAAAEPAAKAPAVGRPVARGVAALCLPLLLAAALAACGPAAGTPEAAARDFLDAHYLLADLQASSLLTTGLAASKVGEEIRLTEGFERGTDTRMPRINYRLDRQFAGSAGAVAGDAPGVGAGDSASDAQAVMMVYRLTVSPVGAEPFDKEVLLRLVKSEGKWLVSNYAESDVSDQ